MKIGLVQTQTGRDENKIISDLKISLASLKSADLILTPECTNLMGFKPEQDLLKNEVEDPVLGFLQEWAKREGTAIMAGSLLLHDPKKGNVNRQLLINNQGEIITRYDKIHMFDIDLPDGESYRESERFSPGNTACVSHIGDLKIGHSICFDLRFPKLYRSLAQNGAQAIAVPAAFTQATGRAHWEVLLRARAIENGVFIIAPAQTGSYVHHDGSTRFCYGHSLVVAPWGEVLTDMGELPSTKLIDLDLSGCERAQAAIPALRMERDFVI